MNTYKRYCLLTLITTVLISFYPLYMGVRVIYDYLRFGAVDATNYPKYIIPYTPICIALIISAALLPFILKRCGKYSTLLLSAAAIVCFFILELLFENMIIVNEEELVTFRDWQMFSCIATPEAIRAGGDILAGEYSPAFKFHFYMISIVLILAILNCMVGFAFMLKQKDNTRKVPLIIQAIAATIFAGLCIFACFTAFFRTGTIIVSAVSAFLMSLFFVLFGMTTGIYIGSFFYRRKRFLSVVLPSVIASVTTLLMYIGELILLDGKLYGMGRGALFSPLSPLPFAIIDLLVILLSGIFVCVILLLINRFAKQNSQS